MGVSLLEREVELRALTAALEAAAAGRGACVLVHGEAGIGKTSLLRAFVSEAESRARAWTGACEDLLTPRTLGPFRDMARKVGGKVSDALATATDPGAVAGTLLDELAYPLETTVLVVEDVHWADDATLDVLRLVGRRIEDRSGLLVVSYRDDELVPDHPLQRVLGALAGTATTRLGLRRLSPEAVTTLSGRPDEELYAVTGGNPFFVTEALASPGEVPMTVRDAVLARLAQLAGPTRAALELLAVVPRRMERSVAEELLNGESDHLAEAEERGILHGDAAYLWFRHELARRAVEEALPVTRRIAHHRRVTDALVAAGADPSRIVHHAVPAGDPDRVLAYGPEAARRAAQAGSHRQAAAHYAQTMRFASRLPVEARAELQTAYAYELYHLRRFAEAAAQAREAVALHERLGHPEALGAGLVTLSRATYWAGDPAGARAAAARAVSVLEPLGRTAGLAAAYVALAHVLMQADDLEATTWARRAHDLAAELGREDLAVQALGYAGTVRMARGDPIGEDTVLHSLRLARAREDPVAVTRVCSNLVRDLIRLGRLDEADRYVQLGLSHARQVEFIHGLYMLQARAGELAALRGRWDEAETTLRELIESFPDAGVNSSLPMAWLGRLAARRGDSGAADLLERAWALAEPTGEIQWIGPVAAAGAEAGWLAADRDAVRTFASRALELADRVEHRWFRGELRRYLARAGDPADDCPGCPDEWRLGTAGDWAAAAAAWERRGNPYERALELLEAPDPGPVLEAVEVLDRLGAAPAARLARQRLRALGVTRVPRGPQPQTRQNPAGLTARQVDVLALLAEGLTNAEIADRLVLSVRTVDHHVAAILDKLAVSSRYDAARAAGELGILPA